jgi:hypothetical protein
VTRTSDLPACNIVPQPTTLSRTYIYKTIIDVPWKSYALIHLCTGRNPQTQPSLERARSLLARQSRMTRIEITVAAERKQVHVKGKKYWIKAELKFISNTHILNRITETVKRKTSFA